jgi:hypothetical protein
VNSCIARAQDPQELAGRLLSAALHGHTATVSELARLGADLNAKNGVRCSHFARRSVSYCAGPWIQCVCLLVDVDRPWPRLNKLAALQRVACCYMLCDRSVSVLLSPWGFAQGHLSLCSSRSAPGAVLTAARASERHCAHARCHQRQHRHGRRARAAWRGHQRAGHCACV